MARDNELRTRIVAEDDASKVIDKVADAADDLERKPYELEFDADTAKVLTELDKISQESNSAAIAAEELGRALGPELSARADTRAIVAELERLGVSADQVTSNVDTLAAKLREIDSPDLGGRMGQALGTARGETEKLADSARGANSAFANMIGNSVQDLGALGGVAGSAGVAIGQMAEYASDAVLGGERLSGALTSMAKVAGPIAGLSLAMQVLNSAMQAASESRAFDAANVSQYFDALREGTGIVNSFNEELRETGQIQYRSQTGGGFLGMFASTKDVLPDLNKLTDGVRVFNRIVDEYVEAGDGSADANDRWRAALEDMGASELEAIRIVKAANQEADARVEAMRRQEAVAKALGGTVEELNAAEQVANFLIEYGAAVREAKAKAMEEERIATEQATRAAEEYAAVVGSTDYQLAEIEGAVAGAQRFAEAQFGLVNIASQAEAAYDGMGKAIEDNGYSFDLNTEAGRANAAQLQTLYSAIIPQLAAAYAEADGDVGKFGASLDTLRTDVMQQLRDETELTEEQIADIVNQMGLVPENVQTQFDLMGAEDASAKLALLSGVLGSLPEDVQRRVTLAVLAGDPQAAVAEIETAVGAAPPTATMGLDTAPAQEAGDAVLDGFNSATATATLDADDRPAEDERRGFERAVTNTKPVVKISGETRQAIAELWALRLAAALLRPVVTVNADTSPAISRAWSAVASIDRMSADVAVDAYIRNIPSSTAIANRIGTVRVPIDAYVRHVPRVDGTRGG